QAALAAENSAVYGYGIVGAHLAGPRRAAAVKDWVAHQTARDTLTAMLTARDSEPVAAAPGYDMPFGAHSGAGAVAPAALVPARPRQAPSFDVTKGRIPRRPRPDPDGARPRRG